MDAINEGAASVGSTGGAKKAFEPESIRPSREPLETTHRAKLTATTEQHRKRHYAQQGRRLPCPQSGLHPTFGD